MIILLTDQHSLRGSTQGKRLQKGRRLHKAMDIVYEI